MGCWATALHDVTWCTGPYGHFSGEKKKKARPSLALSGVPWLPEHLHDGNMSEMLNVPNGKELNSGDPGFKTDKMQAPEGRVL